MVVPKHIFEAKGIYPGSNHILGIQWYSVRDDMKNYPSDTLEKLSAMGYKNVEPANYVDRKFYGYEPLELKNCWKVLV